tara:strand:+ start:5263 stop:6897 length:1635 start_codon:yes stop_codon:yes gene_type:complete
MKDQSNNDLSDNKIIIYHDNTFNDNSYNMFINPLFFSLEDCSNNKNKILKTKTLGTNKNTELRIIKKNSINNKKNNLVMRLNEVLNIIKKERALKGENIYNINKIKLLLDQKINNNNDLSLEINNVKNKSYIKRKELLDTLLKNIDERYNSKKKEDNFLFDKKFVFKFPPPPPPPRFAGFRNSIYTPPNSYNRSPLSRSLTGNRTCPVIKIKKPEIPDEEKELVTIEREVTSLADLLKLIEDYPLKDTIKYNIDMESIHNIKTPLNELNKMIGMDNLKNNVIDQIIYFIQKLHLSDLTNNGDFMHTVIYGPPGTGKTEIAKIIGTIFSGLGVLKKNIFKKATRADFIAGYLGQTALKTKDLIKECLGGVLFIDEAYALGHPEKRDSFAKECIDTLCEALSDNKENLMVIIAGYEEDLDNCFFAYNQGLNSRFPWRFKTDDYSANELKLIFEKKVRDISWSFVEPLETEWFEKNKKYFKFFGRDMETLFSKTKIAHSRRVFCKPKNCKTKLTKKDVQKGFDMFIDNKEVRSRGEDTKRLYKSMYI